MKKIIDFLFENKHLNFDMIGNLLRDILSNVLKTGFSKCLDKKWWFIMRHYVTVSLLYQQLNDNDTSFFAFKTITMSFVKWVRVHLLTNDEGKYNTPNTPSLMDGEVKIDGKVEIR